MSEEAAFLRAIAENPKDDTARLAFADWLQERDDSRAPWVRDAEVWKWMKPKGKNPYPELLRRAKGGNWEAAQTLGKLGPGVVPELLALLPELTDKQADNIGHALGLFGPSAEPALPQLLKAVRSRNKNLRHGAFRCLAGLAPTNAEALQQMVRGLDDKDRSLRDIAMGAIHQAGQLSAQAKAKLTEIVRRGDPDRFRHALTALEKHGPLDHSLIPDLVRHLDHPETLGFVQDVAQEALSRIGLLAARPILDAATKVGEKMFEYNFYARQALGGMGKAVLPILRDTILTSPSPATRYLAAKTWEGVRYWDPHLDQMPWILEGLRAPGEDFFSLRWSAFSAIRERGPEAVAALPGLLELLDELRGTNDRQSVIECIGHLGPAAEPAVPALFAVLAQLDDAESAAVALAGSAAGSALWSFC